MGRPKIGSGKTVRINFFVTDDEMQAINDWRYEQRVPSLSEAIRQLISAGINADTPKGGA